MGTVDLKQPRARSDFTSEEWLRHKLRYYIGHFLSTLRGQRFVWAAFNTVLLDLLHAKGALLHKQSSAQAITKQELKDLCATRTDLVQKLRTYSANVATTSMHWKQHGNPLEWIVRQMSYVPPWVQSYGSDSTHICNAKKRVLEERLSDAAAEPTQDDAPDNGDLCLVDNLEQSEASCAETFSRDAIPSCSEDDNDDEEKNLHSVPMDEDTVENPLQSPSHADKAKFRTAPSPHTPASSLQHPTELWASMPSHQIPDPFGYGRIPTNWYTLNLPYNYLYEIHRFRAAVAECSSLLHSSNDKSNMEDASTSASTGKSNGCSWALDNADLVSQIHALRVELIVRYVIADIVPHHKDAPFQYWLRFEFGPGGNPHVHGQGWAPRGPQFENVVPNEDM